MARDYDGRSKLAQAHSVFVRLVLPPYTIHFKSSTYMKESTLEYLDKKVCKEALRITAQDAAAREHIGKDVKFWSELCALLKVAIPSLERRSFSIWDPSSVDYESTSGALIASHYPGLWKDLERVNDLISISRNVLTVGEAVQDLAALSGIYAEIFRLVNCCVRVTARGYDGDAGTGEEEKWQWTVNAYKKLLITSLQFLNNFVAQNEKRKLSLWISLFDSLTEVTLGPEDVPETSTASLTDVPSNPPARPIPPISGRDILIAFGTNGKETLDTTGAVPLWDNTPFSDWPLPRDAIEGRTKLLGNGYAYFVRRQYEFCIEDYQTERKRNPTQGEMHLEIPRRWYELEEEDHVYWQRSFEDAVARYRQDLAVYEAKMVALDDLRRISKFDLPLPKPRHSPADNTQTSHYTAMMQWSSVDDPAANDAHRFLPLQETLLPSKSLVADDMRMLFTAEAGTKILESGKAELMRRLESYEPPPLSGNIFPPNSHSESVSSRAMIRDASSDRIESLNCGSPSIHPSDSRFLRLRQETAILNDAFEGNADESKIGGADNIEEEGEEGEDGGEGEEEEDDEEESEDAEEDEDYPGSTEDGRGLLTDVPLILGPSEIEVLPMLIMSALVLPANQTSTSSKPTDQTISLHTARTHLLLSHSNGRNLLRELLIFVAAWDLREEELYFKFMVKILEAILQSGLMPYAYHAFRDRSRSKDIISPAQAVIMKLLTCIFRARGEAAKAAATATSNTRPSSQLFAESIANHGRSTVNTHRPSRVDLHILNFIFTEFRQHIIPQTCALIFLQGQIHAGKASPEDFPLNLWDMERMYEGVYQYLEFFAVLTEEGVWKGILGEWEMASELVTLLRELEGGIPKVGLMVHQISKRASNPQHYLGSIADVTQDMPVPDVASERNTYAENRGSDDIPPQQPPQSSPNAIFEAETPLAYPEDPALPLTHDLQHDQDEPSDFEWRNLKKLTVLVLSSLIWKNRLVQDQVRRYGGLEALVGCCRPDEHNPYIREHAIMCLRFAVEGCDENHDVIKRMAALQRKGVSHDDSAITTIEDVPREVLDTNGYETFMDPKGQVGLRRKEGIHPPAHLTLSTPGPNAPSASGISKARFSSSATKMTAEKAAELMQNALRELPLGDNFVTERQKAEALAKLDRAFESTEKVLGQGRKG